MEDLNVEKEKCPNCGFSEEETPSLPHQLPYRSVLNGVYMVGKAIGEGGFGITYIGFNMETDLPVAIKEYFPSELATRDTTQGNVITIFSGEARDLYRDGLDDVSGNYYYNSTIKASYWSDCEVKVLDRLGNIIYFFSRNLPTAFF